MSKIVGIEKPEYHIEFFEHDLETKYEMIISYRKQRMIFVDDADINNLDYLVDQNKLLYARTRIEGTSTHAVWYVEK